MLLPPSIQKFHQNLHRWYGAHGRHDLPWRNTADPYAIYISEIMLQQTQVKTVRERFYAPFLDRFPTLQALADASREAVLKQWEGLGYYTRAANLHEAAKRAAPHLPSTVDALQALPGIGRNTAHAVASFGHRVPVPVMEANVKRILCRIFMLSQPKSEELWDKASLLLDAENPFDYNQAMMDIGSGICTKRAPRCAECPANEICAGKSDAESYPAKVLKKPVPVRVANAVIWRDRLGRLLFVPRETAFLRGLHGVPLHPAEADTVYLHNHRFPLSRKLGSVTQVYSHFHQLADVYLIDVPFVGEGEDWHSPDNIGRLALSGIDHKMLALLQTS